MGMCLGLCTLGDANIAKVLADPPLVWKVIAPDDSDVYEEARLGAGPKPAGLLGKLMGRQAAADPAASFELSDGEGEGTDLDKSWHGIHYLLTGTAWEGSPPACYLAAGGDLVGDIEVGYGPARVLTSEEVRGFHEFLGQITGESLRAKFNPAEMMKLEIYPAIWDRDPQDDDTLGYCLSYFEDLKTFVADAAARRFGLVLYLT